MLAGGGGNDGVVGLTLQLAGLFFGDAVLCGGKVEVALSAEDG